MMSKSKANDIAPNPNPRAIKINDGAGRTALWLVAGHGIDFEIPPSLPELDGVMLYKRRLAEAVRSRLQRAVTLE